MKKNKTITVEQFGAMCDSIAAWMNKGKLGWTHAHEQEVLDALDAGDVAAYTIFDVAVVDPDKAAACMAAQKSYESASRNRGRPLW